LLLFSALGNGAFLFHSHRTRPSDQGPQLAPCGRPWPPIPLLPRAAWRRPAPQLPAATAAARPLGMEGV
jgi:hypothetical protein